VLGEPVEAESVLLIDHEYFLEEVDEQWGGDGLFHDCVIDDFLVHLFVLVVGNDLSEIEARPADVMYNIQQLHRRGHFRLIKGHLPKEHLKEYNAKSTIYLPYSYTAHYSAPPAPDNTASPIWSPSSPHHPT
jgi:hypothetical protein